MSALLPGMFAQQRECGSISALMHAASAAKERSRLARVLSTSRAIAREELKGCVGRLPGGYRIFGV